MIILITVYFAKTCLALNIPFTGTQKTAAPPNDRIQFKNSSAAVYCDAFSWFNYTNPVAYCSVHLSFFKNGGIYVLLRLVFPYFVLLLTVIGYLYYRHLKLGPVLLKLNRVLLSRFSADSLFLILILAGISYLLMRFEMQNQLPGDPMLLGPFTYVFFYGALLLVIIAREIERPSLREKGIATARGFWAWQEVVSYRWTKDVLTIAFISGKRKRAVSWQIVPGSKKEIDRVLKQNVEKKQVRKRKAEH